MPVDTATTRLLWVRERARALVVGRSRWTYALVAVAVVAGALAIDTGAVSRLPVDALRSRWRMGVVAVLALVGVYVLAPSRDVGRGWVRAVVLYGLAALAGVVVGVLAAPAWELVVETWAAGLLVVRPRFDSEEVVYDTQRGVN